MTDDRDPAVADALRSLGRDVERLPWPDGARIRAEGRRLVRRTAVSAGLAVVLALGLGTAAAWQAFGRATAAPLPIGVTPSPSGSSSPSPSSPSPTARVSASPSASVGRAESIEVPAFMLQPSDIGPDWQARDQFRGDWLTEITCRSQDDVSAPPGPSPIAGRRLIYANGPLDQYEQPGHRTLLIAAYHWHPGDAALSFAAQRSRIERCQGRPGPLTPNLRVTIVDSDPVGDDSFLTAIANVVLGGPVQYALVVRHGDVVTELIVPDDLPLILDLGARARARACAASAC